MAGWFLGSDEHYGVVYFGTDPKDLSQTAKSLLRLNRGHSYTIFRVRLWDLKPNTTYYYRVDSEEPDGTSDGLKRSVRKFITPALGQRFVNAKFLPKSG